MKYNSTYIQKTDLKTTLLNIEKIKDKLIKFYKKSNKMIKVTPPMHDLEESELMLEFYDQTRHISFDFGNEYRVGRMFLSHSNWIHRLINQTKLSPGEGIMTEHTYIWRDLKENSSISSERNEITIQVVIDPKVDIHEVVELEMLKLYDQIVKITKEVNPVKTDNFTEEINIFSSQNLSNMMPDLNPVERESKLIMDMNSFILKNPGKKLLNGQRHLYIPPTVYDLNNHYNLFLKDTVNSWAMRVASVSAIATGQLLSDQLKVYKEPKFLELDHYLEITKSKTKIIEIKLNIPRIAMTILEKGHIAEVQPGTTSGEVSHINERYKIKTL